MSLLPKARVQDDACKIVSWSLGQKEESVLVAVVVIYGSKFAMGAGKIAVVSDQSHLREIGGPSRRGDKKAIPSYRIEKRLVIPFVQLISEKPVFPLM